jgi:hypothetical protein
MVEITILAHHEAVLENGAGAIHIILNPDSDLHRHWAVCNAKVRTRFWGQELWPQQTDPLSMFQLIRIGTTRRDHDVGGAFRRLPAVRRYGNLSASRILEIAAQVDAIDQGIQSTSGVDFGLETYSP